MGAAVESPPVAVSGTAGPGSVRSGLVHRDLVRARIRETRVRERRSGMRVERFNLGSIRIDDVTCQQDVVIDRGKIRTRRKKASKRILRNNRRIP